MNSVTVQISPRQAEAVSTYEMVVVVVGGWSGAGIIRFFCRFCCLFNTLERKRARGGVGS